MTELEDVIMNRLKLSGYFARAIRIWKVCYLLLLIGARNVVS
jgi:hypothetical protein